MLVLTHIGTQQMSMTPSCGLGPNGGPPLDGDDLAPLDGIYSLTITQVAKLTAWSRSRIYRFLDEEPPRLRSYKVGKARLIIAQSLRQLLAELAAGPEGALPLPPRRPGGRFAPSRIKHDADQSAALTGTSPAAGQVPRRIGRRARAPP